MVQSANGFAYKSDKEKPAFLPVSAQDYVAGYPLAFGAMVALGRRAREGGSWLVRTSLAGAGHFIRQHGLVEPSQYIHLPSELPPEEVAALVTEHDSPIGRLTHLKPVVQMSETQPYWSRPSVPRGSTAPNGRRGAEARHVSGNSDEWVLREQMVPTHGKLDRSTRAT